MQVLEKCLNFFNCECSGLYQKCFLMLFGCLRQKINHSSEKLKVIHIKCFLSYARINYQFKTSELNKVKNVMEQTVQALKFR